MSMPTLLLKFNLDVSDKSIRASAYGFALLLAINIVYLTK
jgi:hypothetical protein